MVMTSNVKIINEYKMLKKKVFKVSVILSFLNIFS